jgi:hypothetical protein
MTMMIPVAQRRDEEEVGGAVETLLRFFEGSLAPAGHRS